MEISREVRIGMADYLRRVAANLQAISAEELIEIQQNLEAHLYEALLARAPEGPTMDDLRAVLAQMPSPESFAEGTVQLPTSMHDEWDEHATMVVADTSAPAGPTQVLIHKPSLEEEETVLMKEASSAQQSEGKQPGKGGLEKLKNIQWELIAATILLPYALLWLVRGSMGLWLASYTSSYERQDWPIPILIKQLAIDWMHFWGAGKTYGEYHQALQVITPLYWTLGISTAVIASLLAYLALVRMTRTHSGTAGMSLALFLLFVYPVLTPIWVIVVGQVALGDGYQADTGRFFLTLFCIAAYIPLYFLIRRWVRGWWNAYQQSE